MDEQGRCGQCRSLISQGVDRCPDCGYEPASQGRIIGRIVGLLAVFTLCVTTGALGYLSLLSLQQGTVGQAGPLVAALLGLWIGAAVALVAIFRGRTRTPTNDVV
ncbi:hypothetical protein [Natrarchaeobaculum sulfurireducens]|uniref:Uncharacterized protein n=1 Tax=Natrarchaeobaculum sulfurireducens TaxID=2044521 RepID=A0A346PTS1_9EURY|nr:hypothetical protein [Natrarchaeobaculum sulfurireducens]AXR82916.1 hypothetical protein AArcMg_2927 [Natrarchaeobaculum sulfurireducens]